MISGSGFGPLGSLDEPVLTDHHTGLWYVERTLSELARQHAVHESVCDGRWNALQHTLDGGHKTLRWIMRAIILIALVELGRLAWPTLINLIGNSIPPH